MDYYITYHIDTEALQHKLLDHEFNLSNLPQRVAALAALKENAYDSKHLKWLFDFDPVEGKDTEELLQEFLADVQHYHENTQTKKDAKRPTMNVELHKTPNGYGVVVDQRFDTRELLAKWTNVELKRDDLVCVEWARNYYLTVDLNNTHPNTYPFEPEDQ